VEADKTLYNDLLALRESIKEETRRNTGRTVTVCSDEALAQMARLRPRTAEDFRGITGLGDAFIEQYAARFIAVIGKHAAPAGGGKLSASTMETLKELEKKLVNINRKNRLLYLPRLVPKYGFDLFSEDGAYDPLDIIFRGKSVKVCTSRSDKADDKAGVSRYKKLVSLLREVDSDMRDKGQYDLYIGYPFVIGRFAGEDFDVRAPLALFPVEAARDSGSVTLKLDASKDVIYNAHLLLAHYKLDGITRPLPEMDIEEPAEEGFINNTLAFYESEGLHIQPNEDGMTKYWDYTAESFPKFGSGEMYLIESIVLGKFPTYSSSLQKDFEAIIASGEANELVSELLTGIDDIDCYSEDAAPAAETPVREISEHELTYINDLNGSQEQVLTSIREKDALVIQGPPGTGKSQTITSLISDSIGRGSSVLMVSEKKAALDVVYSRMGELNRYALIIDDVNDKQGFYSQMEKILELGTSPRGGTGPIDSKADEIDASFKKLEAVAEKLYAPDSFGAEVYKLYLMSRRCDLTDPTEAAKYRMLKSKAPAGIFALDYPALYYANQAFKDDAKREACLLCAETLERWPWLASMRGDISEYDLLLCRDCAEKASAAIDEYRTGSFVAKLMSKGKAESALRSFADKYTSGITEEQSKALLEGGLPAAALDGYSAFTSARAVYDALTAAQRTYFDGMRAVSAALNISLSDANAELFNLALCDRLFVFEAQNRELLQSIGNFVPIVDSLSRAIGEKKTLTRQYLGSLLAEDLGSVVASKRQGEIARVVESKRRWSVNKFMQKFSFELFRAIKIWLMTPEVASEILPLQAGLFDMVIFDEASQMYVEKGVPSILRAKKVVIAGDSKQLRPSSLGAGRLDDNEDDEVPEDYEGNAALEEESLLDVARFKYTPPVTLNYHYRAKYEELIAFSNYAFYGGRLYVSPNVAPPEKPPIEVHKIDSGLWAGRSNAGEADEIVRLLKEFFAGRKKNESIGIITFNSSQCDLIEDCIDDECGRDPDFAAKVRAETARREGGEDVGLFVKNIENVQGDERDVIMFSIGYAKNESGKLMTNFGWLNQKGGENRLNVAISRAKRKIHVVTSFEPAELSVSDAKNDGPKYLKKYLEYCFAISGGNTELARQILLSLSGTSASADPVRSAGYFQSTVCEALKARGYEVEQNVGIGGYSIDLAIKRGGEYVLGIEFDTKLYNGKSTTRERDFYRGDYLKSRGWKMYRMWSANWWRDQKRELDRIDAMISPAS